MNKTVRSLAMTGVMLTAGLAFGTTPASAAPAASASPAASAQSGTQAAKTVRSRNIRVYETRGGCERAGWRGENRGLWDYHTCSFIRRGPNRGDWLLRAFWDGRGHDQHDGHGHGGNGHGQGGNQGGNHQGGHHQGGNQGGHHQGGNQGGNQGGHHQGGHHQGGKGPDKK